MKSTFFKLTAISIKSAFVGSLLIMASCQPAETEQQAEESSTPETETAVTSAATEKRPAPEFFVVPEEMLKKRVWICEDGQSDIFHVQHDCPVLVQCKGRGSFRNLLITRAIEDYDRYNCQVCSKDLDIIFDQDAVRVLN
ncbi:hypothetical protein [uncultured Pontibacter sp.]|uniref:hypothetical protein n=1 Tax=uncultured Pontibacter sp. TaxID=453356 RepID=UPI002630CE0F|nr:hypothetical protein [uncultured Pontibacter sp.]